MEESQTRENGAKPESTNAARIGQIAEIVPDSRFRTPPVSGLERFPQRQEVRRLKPCINEKIGGYLPVRFRKMF